jgi:glycerol-3-phosphate dehydrogenase (NAD(P)+)
LELPIYATVNAIINEGKSPQEELLKLFLRDKKSEQE